MQKALDVPLQVLMPTRGDVYWRPLPTIWSWSRSTSAACLCRSWLVLLRRRCWQGTARGEEGLQRGASDLMFALNVGLRIETPEEMLHGESQTYERERRELVPRKSGVSPVRFPLTASSVGGHALATCVGAPGSGSTRTCSRPCPSG